MKALVNGKILLSGKRVFQPLDWLEYFQKEKNPTNKCSASKAFNKDMAETNSMERVLPESVFATITHPEQQYWGFS